VQISPFFIENRRRFRKPRERERKIHWMHCRWEVAERMGIVTSPIFPSV